MQINRLVALKKAHFLGISGADAVQPAGLGADALAFEFVGTETAERKEDKDNG